MEGMTTASAPVKGLFVLACLYTVYFARPILLPLALGLILDFLFRPVVRALERWRVPQPVGATLVILGLFAGFGFGLYQLSGPASDWLAKAPRSLPQIQTRLRKVLRPMERVTETAAQVDKMTSPDNDAVLEVHRSRSRGWARSSSAAPRPSWRRRW
jgi:predicted PurR-regulated permease PerM